MKRKPIRRDGCAGKDFRNVLRKGLSIGLVLFFLSGCAAVGPDFVRPEIPLPDEWKAEGEGGLVEGEPDPEALAAWWTVLEDPTLTGLIEGALEGNLDLEEARARIREARARRGISGADRFPTLDASGSYTSSHSSENAGTGDRSELFALGFDAGWEIDLFGGVRRAIEAYEADLEASREDYQDVLVSLVAEVALNYVELRTSQARLATAEANLAAQAETYELAGFRAEAGLASALDVEQARYNLESTKAQIPTLRTELVAAENRLAVLLGECPGHVNERLAGPASIPVARLEIAVGVPAQVLGRRPDVRRAEQELVAQTARVGEATAELYPKITLFGSIGLESLSAGDLFTGGSWAESFGPGISWPVFQAGSIRKNIEVQDALQEQALLRYESAVLAALEEVENAMTAYAEEQLRRASLLEASRAAERAVDLALNQYASGLIDFQDVLDAQRSLLTFQDQLASSEGTVTSDLIRLYKALGGGWTTLES